MFIMKCANAKEKQKKKINFAPSKMAGEKLIQLLLNGYALKLLLSLLLKKKREKKNDEKTLSIRQVLNKYTWKH